MPKDEAQKKAEAAIKAAGGTRRGSVLRRTGVTPLFSGKKAVETEKKRQKGDKQ